MTISDANFRIDTLPLRTPFVTALRRVDTVEYVVLTLQTDNGLLAQGSAPATEAITGETLASIQNALQTRLIPAVTGRPFELADLLRRTENALTANGSAKAAMDMALHALAARQAEMPLFRFLGGREPLALRTAVTVSLDTPEAMLRQAESYADKGFNLLKIKVGTPDGKDAQRITAIADALPGTELIIDANQAWDVRTCMTVIDRAARHNIVLIEQPVPADDITGMQALKRESPIPLLADESVFTAADAKRVLDAEAADLINIKLMKCGGIAGAQQIIALCRTHDIRCMLGSMLEGPESIAAALHLATAHADIFAYMDLDSPLLYRFWPENLPFSVDINRFQLKEPTGYAMM